MARKTTSPNQANVMSLLDAMRLPNTRNFTRVLQELERTYETYPSFNSEDAEQIFQECRQIIERSHDPVLRYNALRLLKYVVTTEDFLRHRVEDIWKLYKKTLFDPDGNVRNAGCQLLSRYRFGMTLIADPFPWKKRTRDKKIEEKKRFQKMAIEQCIELFEIEKRYREKHADNDEIQEESCYGLARGSWDTKEKYLKTIRRGMEEVTRYMRMEDMAKEHGYELPRHWLFDNQISEKEDAKPPYAQEDLLGVLLNPGQSKPLLVSDPPDPKSFSSFEEYKKALDLQETFLEHVQKIDQVLSSGKSEGEIDAAMEALGFQKHDDAPCHRPWCIEQYGCVAISLAHTLRDIEQSFLTEPVTPNQRLLSDHEIEQCEQRYCHALPREWFVNGSGSHIAFRWFMDLMSALEWNKRKVPFQSLANDPLISAFVRESYWFTLFLLRKRPWAQEFEGSVLIQKFLEDNDLLSSEDASHLCKTFLSLRKRFSHL